MELAHTYSLKGVKPSFRGLQTLTVTNRHVYTRAGAYSLVFRAYRSKRARTSPCTLVQEREARFLNRASPNVYERTRASTSWDVGQGFTGIRALTATNRHVHTRQGGTARFSRRTGPNRLELARAHSLVGDKSGFRGVQAQTATNGDVWARQGAYSRVFGVYRPKRARAHSCQVSPPNGHERYVYTR